MLSGVPNFTMVIGYTNASWTLKADLVNRYVCRLINHLDAEGYVSATPVAPPEGADQPFLDLASGYVQRSLAEPAQAGTAHAVAAAPELHPRRAADAARPARRRGHDVPAARARPRPRRRSPDGRVPVRRRHGRRHRGGQRHRGGARGPARRAAAATWSSSTATRSGWTPSPTASGRPTPASRCDTYVVDLSDDAATARGGRGAGHRPPRDDAAGQQRRRRPGRALRPGQPRGVRLGDGGQLPLRRPADPCLPAGAEVAPRRAPGQRVQRLRHLRPGRAGGLLGEQVRRPRLLRGGPPRAGREPGRRHRRPPRRHQDADRRERAHRAPGSRSRSTSRAASSSPSC